MLSSGLLPASWTFGSIGALRRLLYERGTLTTDELPVPVVVVGNIIVGGAGKTPATIAVVAMLGRHGWTPGVVSRGYGRSSGEVRAAGASSVAAEVGDEPILIARRTGAPVYVGNDRTAAAHALLQANPDVDIVVSDDGLQHLALGRDVEIVVFDERGVGNGRLLPAGPLREPLPFGPVGSDARTPSRQRPPRLVLYNAPKATTALPGFLGERRLAGAVLLEDWKRGEPASPATLASLRGRRIVAAAGVSQPGRFFAMLRDQGIEVIELPLADHHDFATLPWPPGTGDVIVTEKDAVKLAGRRHGGARVWVATLDFQAEPAFEAALFAALPPISSADTHPIHGTPTS